MDIPDREKKRHRFISTFMADLNLTKTKKHWTTLQNDAEYTKIIEKYSSQFPLYKSCRIKISMILVHHDAFPHISNQKMKKQVRSSLDLHDMIAYLFAETMKKYKIYSSRYTWDKQNRLIFTAIIYQEFSEPINDLMVRVDIDRNFNHWRFSGDCQWELLECSIYDRELYHTNRIYDFIKKIFHIH